MYLLLKNTQRMSLKKHSLHRFSRRKYILNITLKKFLIMTTVSTAIIGNCFGAGLDLPEPEKYTKVYRDYESRMKSKDLSPCDKLDDLRTTLVTLGQVRGTYWMDSCLRDWPCVFTTHRANIDKITEQLAPIIRRSERECELQMQRDLIDKANTTPVGHTTSSASANSKNINGNGPITYHDHPTTIAISSVPKP